MRIRRFTVMALGGLALSGILATAGPAAADYFDGRDFRHGGAQARIDQRQRLQQQRIHQGMQSGALTQREARFLEREQWVIRDMESRALADGRLSRAEWRQIENAQDQANQNIQRLAHNGAVRRHTTYR